MKQVKIFHQYAWIINTLKSNKRVTFEELKRLWILDEVADGKPLYRSTFNRHRDDIQKMFGIVIDCDMKTYEYYIGNPNALSEDSIEQWLYSTITVHGMLSESTAVKDRVVLENVATGLEYLQTIIEAINTNHCLLLGYQKFGTEGYVKTVCPYAIKLFHQRWYLLAKTACRRPDAHLRLRPHTFIESYGRDFQDACRLLATRIFLRVFWCTDRQQRSYGTHRYPCSQLDTELPSYFAATSVATRACINT